ncbi:MAG: amidohydrolase family protein [Gammaproteobacteria bacterium]|nr:MAG: amidohydrolase family protein [Gammaproteobacteria bacterium]|tara:strand:+ start:3483 stop:4772 length:1290 start_codon:yes stop_codon:yes gene_type:complete
MKKINTYLFALFLMSNIAYGDTLIHAGKMIDGISVAVIENVTLRIKESKIQKIEAGFIDPDPNDTLIDLRDQTVLPGLIDTHVHLTGEYNENSRLKRFISNEADYALDSALYAKKTLEAGFTVVRNLGDTYNVTIALNKAIKSNKVPGPMIFTAGKTLSSTGGHGDPTNGWAKIIMGDPGPNEGIVNGIEDARKAVRQRYKDGADWIKITATGGVLSVAKSGENPQFTDDELTAIVETAKDYGMRVAAHAHGSEGMKRAVLAGVASVEHGTYMNREIMDLMIDRGTYYVPTLLASDWVAEKAEIDGFFPELVRPKAAEIGPVALGTFTDAYNYGVPIVFGTDTGVSAHGDNAQEFALMVQGGMPEMEAIQSATSVAAKFLGIENTHGSIEIGKQADLISVAKDPLRDISSLENINFVMKAGLIYKNELL